MENAVSVAGERRSNLVINIVSVAIPLVVAILLGLPTKLDLGQWTRSLPHAIGLINTLTTVALVLGLVFIKTRNIKAHQAMMTSAFGLGGLFLVCYVLYHLTNPSNKFTGEGFVRYVYFYTLVTHIGLSLIVLPLVLRGMYFAATEQFAAHRRIVRYAFPIWLYVSVTGVMVYAFVYLLYPAR